MKIRPLKFELPKLDSSGRSGGLHLSQVIKYICVRMDPKRFGRPVDRATLLRWEVGFAWESLLGDAFSRRAGYSPNSILVQHEIERDGIFMTPDALNLFRWRLDEYKATWVSANRPITDRAFWHWFVQIKGYLHALEMTRARLYVWHINGTYRPMEPLVRVYEAKFSQTELAENWRMILRHRKPAMEWLKKQEQEKRRAA